MTLYFIHCICSIGHSTQVEALKYHLILRKCSCNKGEVYHKAEKNTVRWPQTPPPPSLPFLPQKIFPLERRNESQDSINLVNERNVCGERSGLVILEEITGSTCKLILPITKYANLKRQNLFFIYKKLNLQYVDGTHSEKPVQEFAPCIRKSKEKNPTQNPKIHTNFPHFMYQGRHSGNWAHSVLSR